MLSNNIHSLVAALAFLTISGCGQEKELVTASEVLDPPTIKFSAIDGLLHAEPGILREVDLRQYVVDGEGVEFTDVVSLNPHCAHPKLSDVGFDVYPEKGGLCDYRYTAALGGERLQATISIFGTQARTPILPSVSYSIPAEQQVSNISLPTLLGFDFPNGYTLDKVERLTSNGGMNGVVISHPNSNVINYTRNVNEFGWDRLRYTLVGGGNIKDVQEASVVEDVLMGEIYILSSRATDSGAPTIGNPNASYQPSVTIKAREAAIIDLAKAGMQINESNPDDYQLIEVQSFSASVSATAPSDVTNKRFNFQAAMPGEHVVSYIVSNHYGEYSMGLIRIEVSASQSGKVFSDIAVSDDTPPQLSGRYTLTAPPLYNNDITKVFNVKPIWDGSTGSTLAGFTSLDTAQAYCGTLGGSVPALTDRLSNVITDAIQPSKPAPWPGQVAGYGHIDTALWAGGLLVACAKYSSMKWNALATTLYVSDTFQDIGVLTKDTAAQNVTANLTVGGSIKTADIQFEMTSEQGSRQVFVKAKSSKQGTFAVQFSDSSNPAMFINSSEMTFNMSKCNSYAQSLSGNCIGVEVFDSTKPFFVNSGYGIPSKPHLVVMPPSSAALTALGYAQNNTSNNSGKTYAALAVKGAQFRADGQGVGGQAARWCNNLSQIAFMGRRDWMMPNQELINGVYDDRNIRFVNFLYVVYGFDGVGAWLRLNSHAYNSIYIGHRFAVSTTNTPLLVFCIAPLDVERVNLNVSVDNVTSNGAEKNTVEATLYHSNNQPATGVDVSFKVNNGALFSNGTDSIIVRTGRDGKASVEVASTTEGVVTVTAIYRDSTNLNPDYTGITKVVNINFSTYLPDNIVYEGISLTPLVSYNQAVAAGLEIDSTLELGYTIAVVNHIDATKYCESINASLPTIEFLVAVYNEKVLKNDIPINWPLSHMWSGSAGNIQQYYQSFDFSNGLGDSYHMTETAAFSCVY